jgi:hypothetical protein
MLPKNMGGVVDNKLIVSAHLSPADRLTLMTILHRKGIRHEELARRGPLHRAPSVQLAPHV